MLSAFLYYVHWYNIIEYNLPGLFLDFNFDNNNSFAHPTALMQSALNKINKEF